MPESNFQYLVMLIAGITTAAFGYAASRYGGRTNLAMTTHTNHTAITIDERADLRREAEALRQEVREEMDRLREDNQLLRNRVTEVERELNTTRLTNLTLEHERTRLTNKVTELETEITDLRQQMNGSTDE